MYLVGRFTPLSGSDSGGRTTSGALVGPEWPLNAYIANVDYARNYTDMNYYCRKAGFQAPPITLAQHYENMSGKISLLAQVSRLDRESHNGEDFVKLTFGTPSKGAVEHRFARHV